MKILKIFEEKLEREDKDVLPFGFVSLGINEVVEKDSDGTGWMLADPENEIDEMINSWNMFF